MESHPLDWITPPDWRRSYCQPGLLFAILSYVVSVPIVMAASGLVVVFVVSVPVRRTEGATVTQLLCCVVCSVLFCCGRGLAKRWRIRQ